MGSAGLVWNGSASFLKAHEKIQAKTTLIFPLYRSLLYICYFRYVGSHTVVELLREEYNVIVVDNFVNSIKGKWWFLFNQNVNNYTLRVYNEKYK